jgi:hypothetical protein
VNPITNNQECEDTLPSQKGEGVMSGSVELHILLYQYLVPVFPGIMELYGVKDYPDCLICTC